MNLCFADTFFSLALLSEGDEAHERALTLNRSRSASLITTAWVLTEVGDALARPATRALFSELLRVLQGDPDTTIVGPAQSLFKRGIGLYADRPDKGWTLTDCISFVVMAERGLREALTGDHHFEQAGFVTLF